MQKPDRMFIRKFKFLIITVILALAVSGPSGICMGRSALQMPYDPQTGVLAQASSADSLDFITRVLNCLTPEMFGAKGNGRSDDTDALRQAIYESDSQGRLLFIPAGQVYKVTGTLNYYKGEYRNYTLNLLGNIPVKRGEYAPSKYGGITVAEGVSLFKNATIRGSIQRISLTGQRKDNVRVFDNCTCSALSIKECNISQFGALFYDTTLNKVCQIIGNTFLTVFYFSRNEQRSAGMTDSTISYNYINGGKEKRDNACFEWGYYNGSLITNNFIDYYRTMYYPVATSKQIFVGPVSSNNHYQVFCYFYAPGPNIQNIVFYSYGDAFNWTDPSSEETLGKYIPFTYKGDDGKTYDIPPYIARCGGPWQITVKAAKIEQHVKSIIYIGGTVTEYEGAVFDVDFSGNNTYADGQVLYKQGSPAPIYNNGKFKQNRVNISGIVEKVDALPRLGIGRSTSVNGRKVLYKGEVYTATNIQEGSNWKCVWQKNQE